MVRINEDDPDAEQLIVSKTYIRHPRRSRHSPKQPSSVTGEEKMEVDDDEEEEEEEIVTHYVKGRFIGKGGFARVYEFRCLENGQVYAGKVIPKCSVTTGNQKRKLITEIRIHRSLSHPNIVRFVQSFTDEDNYYIVLELCRHQTLLDVLRCRGSLPEPEVRYWLAQLLRALAYLRGVLVLHRDLKLGNLFVCDGMVLKVGDFGLSACMASTADRKRSICGTPNYIAPEVLASGSSGGHGLEVDIWSFGVILYTLLVGAHPFEAHGSKETYARIRSGEYRFPGAAHISAEAKDLIAHVLVTDPAARYTLDQVAAHPFFSCGYTPAALPVHALVTDPQKEEVAAKMDFEANTNFEAKMDFGAKIKKDVLGKYEAEMVEEPYVPPPGVCELNALKHAVLYALDVSLGAQTTQYVPVPRVAALTGADSQLGLGAPRHDRVVTVRKWVDYSQQYGLGYLLSDGSVGAYYNDASKILLTRKRRYKSSEADRNSNVITAQCQQKQVHRCIKYIYENTLSTYRTDEAGETGLSLSHDRLKKLRIVNSFRTFLCDPTTCSNEMACSKETAAAGSASGTVCTMTESVGADVDAEAVEVFADAEEEMDAEVVMVTHYYKLHDGIAFRFSNGSMQVNFLNKARVLVVPWWREPVRFLGADGPVTVEAQREYVMSVLHAINKLLRRYAKPQGGGKEKEEEKEGKEEGGAKKQPLREILKNEKVNQKPLSRKEVERTDARDDKDKGIARLY